MLFRSLKDPKKNEPALFIERIYPLTLSEGEKKALLDFAHERAQALSMPLYTKELPGKSTNVTLVSKGGRGPYQYVDSAAGNMPGGVFELNNVKECTSRSVV